MALFRKKKEDGGGDAQESTASPGEQKPKYDHPKILLIDLPGGVAEALADRGYNVSSGSFGRPYKTEIADEHEPVLHNGKLPADSGEQEIIVIDLTTELVDERPTATKYVSDGTDDWWGSCAHGFIDPRPRQMAGRRLDFDRIFQHGGFSVVFARRRRKYDMRFTHVTHGRLEPGKQIHSGNWSFLSAVDLVSTSEDVGREHAVAPTARDTPELARLLSDYSRQFTRSCVLEFHPRLREDATALITNKHGKTAAALISPEQHPGRLLILPHPDDKQGFLLHLFDEVLPALSPHLFPDASGLQWVQQREYEHPRVLELKAARAEIQRAARKQLEAVDQAIAQEREERVYLHDLIRGTDTTLVEAVKHVLSHFGFEKVVDVDEQLASEATQRQKREDLQIHDRSPILVVEVKGVSGRPSEADALEAQKYVAPRMKEWDRRDVQALPIINHQRHVRALDRENAAPFSADILTNARQHEFGLLTTWDLFRLARSAEKNNWPLENVQDVLYRIGRIEPVPSHYEHLGTVDHFFDDIGVVRIKVEQGGVGVGDRIAFELPVVFEEQAVESLHVDEQKAERADTGCLATIKTHLTKQEARRGVRIFVIKGQNAN